MRLIRLLVSRCFLPVSGTRTVALLFMIWFQYYSPQISGSLDYTMNDNSVEVLIKSKLGQYCPDGSSSNVISGGSRLAWPSDFIVCYSQPALSHRKQVFLSFNYMSAPKMPWPLCDIHFVWERWCMPPFKVCLQWAKANANAILFSSKFILLNGNIWLFMILWFVYTNHGQTGKRCLFLELFLTISVTAKESVSFRSWMNSSSSLLQATFKHTSISNWLYFCHFWI